MTRESFRAVTQDRYQSLREVVHFLRRGPRAIHLENSPEWYECSFAISDYSMRQDSLQGIGLYRKAMVFSPPSDLLVRQFAWKSATDRARLGQGPVIWPAFEDKYWLADDSLRSKVEIHLRNLRDHLHHDYELPEQTFGSRNSSVEEDTTSIEGDIVRWLMWSASTNLLELTLLAGEFPKIDESCSLIWNLIDTKEKMRNSISNLRETYSVPPREFARLMASLTD